MISLFVSENDPSFGQVVWRHFNVDLVTFKNADAELL